MINVMFYAYFAKTSKVRVLFKYFIYFWNKTEKMITIKCFGKVEISGDVQLPLNVAIESTDEISVTSENKLITSENKLTSFI